MSFLGYVTLSETLKGDVLTRNSSLVPTNADSLPTYRIYGPNGLMTSGTGTTALRDTGSVTSASNASPVVITTSAAHGLTTGTRVTIAGVTGSSTANGTFVATVLTTTTFSLDGTSAGGAGTGGTWNTTGLYLISHAITAGNGYEAGTTYTILVSFAISSTSGGSTFTFIAG